MKLLTRDSAILVLEYCALPEPDQGILQRQWCSTRKAIRRTGCLDLFVGRMNHVQGTITPNSHVYPVKNLAKANTVLVFGYPCAKWWNDAIKAVKSLEFFQEGKLSIRHLFIGYEIFPLDLLEIISDDECPNKHHPAEELNQEKPGASLLHTLITDWKNLDVIAKKELAEKELTEILYEIVKELSLNQVKCIHFDFYSSLHYTRSLCDLMITSGKAQFLHKAIDEVIKELYTEICFELEALDNDLVFQKLANIWTGQRLFWQHCALFFSVLDSLDPDSVLNIGYNRWIDDVILSPKLRIPERVVDVIHISRSASAMDCSLKNITAMLMDMGQSVYIDLFENPYLECFAANYHWLEQRLTGVNHPEEVSSQIHSEIMDAALLEQTREKLINLLGDFVMAERAPWMHSFILHGCDLNRDVLLDKLKDLAISYDLIGHWIPLLRTSLGASFGAVLTALSKDPESNPFLFISDILQFMDSCKEIIATSLRNNVDILEDMHKSVGMHINAWKNNPEYLSLFIDSKLQEAARGNSMDDIEAVLNKVTILVQLWHDLCTFQEYYLKHLSRRLVFGTTTVEAEDNMLSKLKNVCEPLFIKKSKRLLIDSQNSAEMMETFRSTLCPADSLVSVNMFYAVCWPSDCKSGKLIDFKSCKLPPEVAESANQFETYYATLENCAGRKVIWKTNEGNAILVREFDDGKIYEFNVSTYQMCVLTLFNKSENLSFQDIQKATDIPILDLEDALHSLCEKKVLVASDSDISMNSMFSVNASFSHSSPEVQICDIAPAKESELERNFTSDKAKENRNPAIDAAIIRILKSKRRLIHRELVAEVVKGLRKYFEPELVDIRLRIEDLIEREYIARDSINPVVYHYLE